MKAVPRYCNECPNCKKQKFKGDEVEWFICKLTGGQLYNRDRYQDRPNWCLLNDEKELNRKGEGWKES